MNADSFFAGTYAEARDKFRSQAAQAGWKLSEHRHPSALAPDGQPLSCDVARWGPQSPRHLVIVSSGTHGVEGFCGSGCQVGVLVRQMQRALPANTAMLLVHAINPYGFAHLRRVNEDNVDCNRNFVDFSRVPRNPSYAGVHDWLVPKDWDGPARRAADAAIGEFIRRHGLREYQVAVTGGQYEYPQGLFYGGRAPVWSNRLWRRIVREEGSGAHIVAIDVHTGLGPSGVGEAIFIGDVSSAEHERARLLFGDDVTSISAGTSTSAPVSGVLADGARAELDGDRLTMMALEYGTHPLETVLQALRADNWLHVHGHVDSDLGRSIKRAIRDGFYVDESKWKRAVVDRAFALIERIGAHLPHVS